MSDNVLIFALGLLLTGVSFSWIDAPSRALMSDLLQDQHRRELALQLRYFAVNIAAVSGPLIGITFGLNSQKSTFFITALSYVPFLFFILLSIPTGLLVNNNHPSVSQEHVENVWQVMAIIVRDKTYLIALISSILCYLVYAQIESIVPQYLLMLDATQAVDLVTLVLMTNAVTSLIAQFYLVSFLAKYTLVQRIILGGFLFAFSQLLFWDNDSTTAFWWGMVTVVFGISEAILLPNISILLDHLAPEKHRGAYLGASTMVVLGLSMGPFVGGVFLEWTGKWVFIVMSFLCLTISIIMLINKSNMNLRMNK